MTESRTLPSGVTTTYTYDPMSRLATTTEPATKDAVTGVTHQRLTTYTYDTDGNLTATVLHDAAGHDADRTTAYTYDEHNRVASITDPTGHETGYATTCSEPHVDDRSERQQVRVRLHGRNKIAEVRLRDWDGDPPTAPDPARTGTSAGVLRYDFAGRWSGTRTRWAAS